MQLPRLRRRTALRPVLLLIDVSGSMKTRTDAHLRLAHRLAQVLPRIEIFTLGTRLTRITRALRLKQENQALAASGAMVADWDGGTRIGAALRAFLAVPRFAGFARGAWALVLSDGLERGEPEIMVEAVRRLARLAWRLDWLSPLAGDPDFRPHRRPRRQPALHRPPRRRQLARGDRPAHPFRAAPMTGIIDAHHHIWRQADLPWLAGPMQPRIFGPYEPIRRDYPITEYLDDIAGSGVVRSIYVQANWPPERFLDEAVWVQETADEHGWPHAIVAYADLTVPDARPQLDALARLPLVRGIRQQLHWHRNPMYRFASRPDLAADPVVQSNVGRLADYGLAFELQVFAPQMAAAAALADACPEVTFVLQHAGMLEDLSGEGRAAWRDGMARLAACANVASKLSGLGTFSHRNDSEHIGWIVDQTLALFGPERCLFGSNFPIEKLWTGYQALIDAFRRAVDGDGATAVFHDTAARIYQI